MRIVTCITRLIRGGAQRIALETAAALAARGHDASIWCGPETGPEGSLHEEAAARGVRVRIVPHLCRAAHPWHDACALRDLVRSLRRERPDLLHTHSSKAGILGREAARRAGVTRVVHTVHGWGFTPQTPRWLAAGFISLERRCAPVATMVFVNPGDREEALRYRIVPPSGSCNIAPGIDLAPFRDAAALRAEGGRIRRALGIPGTAVVGGFLGRLAPQKAPEILLEAAEATASSHPELQWLVVGDGPMAAALRRRAEGSPSLAARVHWAGLQTEVSPWLAAMDFLLFPSRWEGTPLTLMEAMAAGLPAIAADLPGARWVLDGLPATDPIADGPSETTPAGPRDVPPGTREARPGSFSQRRAGLTVAPGDVAGFASAADSLAGNADVRERTGSQARALACERFGLEIMTEKLLSLYTVVCGPRAARHV